MKDNYGSWGKEELISRVRELESNLDDLLKIEDDKFLVEFPWVGNLGQWYWYYKENKVVFNDKKVNSLGYNPKEVGKVGFEFFTEKLHPGDYDCVMENMRNHLSGKSNAYEVEYRIKHKDGHYIWYYDRGTIVKRDENGQPILMQGIVFDITESKKIEEKLRYLSERDALTDVFNRRIMYKKLNELIDKFKEQNESFSLIMLDIDHFKQVNDVYGHLVGDEVLQQFAKLILKQKRVEDIVCRYGGEEFFILLPNTGKEEVIKLAKGFHQSIRNMDVPLVGHITVSMGCVTYQSKETIDDVIKRVDDLMYEAKEAGRDIIKY